MFKNPSRKTIITVFMIGAFAVGMTEYVVTGLLTQFAADLDVAVSTTGLLLSVYALSVALFGPVIRLLTLKFSPKLLLLILVSIFIISNIIAATAPNFEVLLLSRLLSASMHAPFFGVMMSLAMAISPPHKKTSAIALVNGGLVIAVMLGVPFGSYIGSVLDWRVVFWMIVTLGVITLMGMILVTPNYRTAEVPKISAELSALKDKNVIMLIVTIVFGFSGVFTAYTFLEPMLREIANMGDLGVTFSMLMFGTFAVIGNFSSGSIQPGKLTGAVTLVIMFLAIVLFGLTFMLQVPYLAYIAAGLFGLGTFGISPMLNAKIIFAAVTAPALAGTLAASVFNLANAIGASLGSALLSHNFSYTEITFVAGGMLIFGALCMVATHFIEDKNRFTSES
ncbi:MFS transporter [Jeotgalicoccus coquinae]|uniref:Inner membrane transport protein YdhP n=1 Tax=Jeotgalicoccus coquinae TaxID=709509 RepID=A0A6V7R4B2_9STAP|nr:MFS transporter [Jeotgalicoccus coquinae]MBB6423355.1 putative MFS family arabinose efflux permease [Jeotgalicoccus coquinae]GGE19225.1 MFS transporter [Jeotgalicoccus coquinae]CAD2071884.1 Inner membrane transport protein YdhP [Jeotgalicoccus coquinae]